MASFNKTLKKIASNQKYYNPYYNRESRYQFVAKMFNKYLKISVLDVGSSKNFLKKYISNDIDYVSVDIVGEPTHKIDLEKEVLSRFDDMSFNTVVCTEVLEHLNNIHEVFDDLCRVSKQYIIISLPNNWIEFKYNLIKNSGNSKFYGLPVEKPIDRHKWFFNYDEALNFIRERGKLNNFTAKLHFPVPFIQFGLKRHIMNFFFKMYYGKRFGYNNLYYFNVWVLLEKKD